MEYYKEDEMNMLQNERIHETEMPLISIIVPVYQVRDYVGECVESIRQQTYTNLEILLVDDGSTDGSGEMCDEYARTDERIRVIHQENRGQAGARNTGLDNVQGEYIAFVDSDDLVLPDYIEVLYMLLTKHAADLAACAYVKGTTEELAVARTVSGKQESSGDVEELCISSEKMLRQWHGKYKMQETVVWNKLYHKDVWNGKRRMRFPEGRSLEDVLISHLIIESVERIALTTQALYFYRVRDGSITVQTKYDREKIRRNLEAQRERMVFFRERRYWRAYFNLLVGYLLHWGWFVWWAVRRF